MNRAQRPLKPAQLQSTVRLRSRLASRELSWVPAATLATVSPRLGTTPCSHRTPHRLCLRGSPPGPHRDLKQLCIVFAWV